MDKIYLFDFLCYWVVKIIIIIIIKQYYCDQRKNGLNVLIFNLLSVGLGNNKISFIFVKCFDVSCILNVYFKIFN